MDNLSYELFMAQKLDHVARSVIATVFFSNSVTLTFLSLSCLFTRYFKTRDGLPDPSGSLSGHIQTEAITLANWERERELRLSSFKLKFCRRI